MISSNTRATRSRYSSPAQTQNGSWNGPLDVSKGTANEASRNFMQNWLEPSVQSKPSYEEAGLVRYGVVESMAPLGSLPKSKRPGGENGPSVRRIILRPSGAGGNKPALPSTSTSTGAAIAVKSEEEPEAEPEAEPRKPLVASRTSLPGAQRRSSLVVKEANDDDYDPKGAPRRRQSGRVVAPKKTRQPSGDCRSSLPVAKPETPKRTPRAEPEDTGFADKVVEAAVDEALKHYRYPTAWALRTLYDEKCGDANFVAMIEDIFSQSADDEAVAEFSRMIEEKKREGKKDNRGCYYFVPPSTNSRFTPHKPKNAPYASLIHHRPGQNGDADGEHNRQGQQSEGRAAKKAKTSSEPLHVGNTPRKMARNRASSNTHQTPSRKRARRDTGSSESSLSSAMSLSSPEDSVGGQTAAVSPSFRGGSGLGAKGRGKGRVGATGAPSHDAPKSQPITTRRKSLNKQAVSNTSEPNSPTRPSRTVQPSTANPSMPGRLAASELFPNLPTKTPKKSTKEGGKALQRMPDDDDAFWSRRKDAQKASNNFHAAESSVRGSQEERDDQASGRKTRKTRHSLIASASTRATRSASKKPNDDAEGTVSPISLSFYGEPNSAMVSRAGTPSTALRPAKKQKTGLRIKSSPIKKKGGTAAGVPRSMSDANTALNNGTPKDVASDNDEYCSACGNAGDVLCCDGCPRSFHFECVDLDQAEDLPDEWYCNECLIRKYPSRIPIHKGAFGSVLNNLEKSIPRAFSLPSRVQNRFEGVKAGADGDYEEVLSKTAKKRPGYEDVPDFFKQREDGQAVLCHACQTPATEIRAILPCSACPLHWHLDCLDPPMAVPPVLKTWRCPAHIDDILAEEPQLAPAHRFRKFKGNNNVITPAITRGVRNNGHIEIEWDDDDDDSAGSGWPDPQSFGKTYKLPAQSVILDFIEQLRQHGAGYGVRKSESKRVRLWVPPINNFASPLTGSSQQRKLEEMQVSLNLIGLKQKRPDSIDRLTTTLLSAADENVLALMARGNAENIASGQLTEDDKISLRAMLAQMDALGSRIRDVLGGGDESPQVPPPALAGASSPPITEPLDPTESSDLAKSIGPLTEPTPPSTVDQGENIMDVD